MVTRSSAFNFRDEQTYSKLLRDNFLEIDVLESDKRIDFLCQKFGESFFIIELKRPSKVIGSKELDQALNYVAFIRKKLSNQFGVNIYCYIIGKSVSKLDNVELKADVYASSNLIYFKPYEELLSSAIAYHQEFINTYEKMNIIEV